jgi:hypothetical protein
MCASPRREIGNAFSLNMIVTEVLAAAETPTFARTEF